MSKRIVSWTKSAAVDFVAAIEYIRRHSDSQADKVKQKLLEKIVLSPKHLF
jgi:plasmid stabilization system protein ParE